MKTTPELLKGLLPEVRNLMVKVICKADIWVDLLYHLNLLFIHSFPIISQKINSNKSKT